MNGRSAGILWKKPYRAEITGLVKEGENELRIEVVNMWINRLTGDIEWKNGDLAAFSVTSDNGGKYTLRYREKIREISLQKGGTFRGGSDF